MGFLIDTNVLSELRNKKRCDPRVKAWQHDASGEEMFVSTISLMEIRHGILLAKKENAAFAKLLEEWYETQVKPTFAGRILSIDLAVSEQCSSLLSKRTRDLADALIAATAHVNDLTLVTRNTADFVDCGIRLVNPWEPA